MNLEGEKFGAQLSISKCFQIKQSDQPGQTCSGWGMDMSGQALKNPVWEPDKSNSRDLTWVMAERPDMSGLGAGHVWDNSLKLGYGVG
jgi:hypothetical protein